MDPSVGMLSPAADTNLTDDSVMFASVEKLATRLCSINEIEDPESTIMSTSLFRNTTCLTAVLGWTAAVTAPANFMGLRSWDVPAPSGISLGHFSNNGPY